MFSRAARHLVRSSFRARAVPTVRCFYSSPNLLDFLKDYQAHVAERAQLADGLGVAPQALKAAQVSELIDELQNDKSDKPEELVELLSHRVPPGVDEAAYVKATFLSAIAKNETTCSCRILCRDV